jgi:putative membrane protein
MKIETTDQARISAAIHAAEQRTSGEIICVLARSSSDYATMPLAWAIILGLAVPWALLWRTQWSVERILLAQLAVFAVAMLVLSAPAIRVRLTPRRVQRAHAYQAAAEQFMNRGFARTKKRVGVLIFVSLAERYARIIADEGVAAKVPQKAWQDAIDALTGHMGRDGIADGFVAAIEKCGDILSQHLPPEPGQQNEMPDRLFVI